MAAEGTHLEKALLDGFRKEILQRAVRDTRRAALVAIAFFLAFVLLDRFIYPALSLAFLWIRVGVAVFSAGVFLLLRIPRVAARALDLAVAEYLVCCLSIVVMVHLTEGYASPYYAGVNLVLIGFLVLLPLDLRRTAFVCVLVYGAYILPTVLGDAPVQGSLLLNNNMFLLTTIGLVNLSAHVGMQMRLREYTARWNLAAANENLRELDKLKTQFFANVSHEVRTPLTSILGPIQSMSQGDTGPLTPEQQSMVEQVYRNSLRLLDLINQMLDFARLEAGRAHLRLSLVDLNDMVEETVSVFQHVTARKGISLKHLREGGMEAIHLDRDRVERVLTNLVRNAIKFTDEGGVTIRVYACDKAEGPRVCIDVEDTGIGIPEEHLGHVFERFRQVDGSTTRRHEGAGLGLAIVKESVDLLRGLVTVRSALGKGTSFTVEFPTNLHELEPTAFEERRETDRRSGSGDYYGQERRAAERRREDLARVSAMDVAFFEGHQRAAEEDEPGPSVTSADANDTVLLVEDNADLRSYVAGMLRRLGHTVITAGDGLRGWYLAQNEHPDVIVSDVMMPGMDGYELLRHVKSSPLTRNLPFVLITAKAGLEPKIRGLETGADDYLRKPISIRELDARVRNLVSLRRFERAQAQAEALEARMHELSLGFAQSLEIRDFKTGGHSRDVLELGSMAAREMGLPIGPELRVSLLLHDIGKIGIPDRILLKPSPLDEEEWAVMKKHPEIGYDLLRGFETFREISLVILAHQEHYDGSGYPRGLRGAEIPLAARIVAVADAYHAMTNDRPYRGALTPALAVRGLMHNRGTQFDPSVVDAFVRGLVRNGTLAESDLQAVSEDTNNAAVAAVDRATDRLN